MASNIQRIEEKKRLRTTSPTGWVPKKPVEEDPWLVKLLSLDCKDGNAGVCIVSTSIGKDESRTRGFCTAIPQRRYFVAHLGHNGWIPVSQLQAGIAEMTQIGGWRRIL